MRANRIALCLACALLCGAQTPAPSDRVTVTGEKEVSRKIIDDFIASQAAPTEALDKMARWNVPVCPMAVGVPKDFARFVSQARGLRRRFQKPAGIERDGRKTLRPRRRDLARCHRRAASRDNEQRRRGALARQCRGRHATDRFPISGQCIFDP